MRPGRNTVWIVCLLWVVTCGCGATSEGAPVEALAPAPEAPPAGGSADSATSEPAPAPGSQFELLEVHRNLAHALTTESEYAAAWPHVEHLFEAGDDSWWLHLAAAQICLYWSRDYDCVETHGERALELAPDNARAHLVLGQMHQERNELEQAIQHYRQSLAIRPSEAEVSLRLANLLEDAGRHDEAVATVAAALQQQPSDAHLMLRLARLIERSDPDYAESLYRLATRYHEEPTLAYGHLIRFYERQGRRRDAESARRFVEESVGERRLRPIW